MRITVLKLKSIFAICFLSFIMIAVVQADMPCYKGADQHYYFPDGFVSSTAFGVESYGYIEGYTLDNNRGSTAIIRYSAPEPGTFLLLGIGTIFLFRNRELRKKQFDSKK